MDRILIVDDEPDNLLLLQEMLQYDFEEETEVQTADSGKKALRLLEEEKFDVVLTDIKMPGMDGITLFEEIKKNWPACRVIFLTAYPNFDDVYKIIQNPDVKYLLKSEGEKTIKKTVREALEELRAIAHRKEQEERMEQAKYMLESDALCHLIQKQEKEGGISGFNAENIRIDLKRQMLCALVKTENGEIKSALFSMEKYLSNAVVWSVYLVNEKMALVLAQLRDREDWRRLFTLLEGALEYVLDTVQAQEQVVSAVISSTPFDEEKILEKLLEMRNFLSAMDDGESKIAHAEQFDIRQKQDAEKELKPELLKHYLELGQKEAYFSLLREFCMKLNRFGSIHDTNALALYYQVAVTLLQFINEKRWNEKLAFRIGLYKLVNFNEYSSWIEAGNYLFTLSEILFEFLGNSKDAYGQTIQKLIYYIDQHCFDDLTLTRLAKVSGFNANYLSRLFKKTYGEGLAEYITRKRMEQAKVFLLESDDKIQDIAQRVGYQSAHSFSRAFRAITGISPVEFRENKR